MKPPPPGPVSGLSHTHETHAAATHASTAVPPASSTRAPASAVSGWPAAIAPFMAQEPNSQTTPAPVRLSRYEDRGQHAHARVSRIGRRGLVAAGGLLVMLAVLVATPQLLGTRVDAAVGSLHRRAELALARRHRLPALRARRRRLLAVRDPPLRRPALARRRVRPLRRRLARQHLRPLPRRRRRPDRTLLARAAEPRAALDDRRRLRGARRRARGRARGARRRRLARRRRAALAAVRPAGLVAIGVALAVLASRRPPGGRVAHLLDAFRALGREPRGAVRLVAWIALSTAGASPRRPPSARRSASATRSPPRS